MRIHFMADWAKQEQTWVFEIERQVTLRRLCDIWYCKRRMMDSWEEMVNSQKTQLMNQTMFCPVQDQVLSNNKICQNPIMPDEEEGFNSLVIYFFFPVLALTAILLVSLSYFFLPTHLRICVYYLPILMSLFVLAVNAIVFTPQPSSQRQMS